MKFQNEIQKSKSLNAKIPQEQKLPVSIANTLERELLDASECGYVMSRLEIIR